MGNELGFEAFSQHFDKDISQVIRDYVDNDVLIGSRYLFIKRAGGVQFGYCTHCRTTSCTDGSNSRTMVEVMYRPSKREDIRFLKHGDISKCPSCGSRCQVRAHGISRKYVYDSAYVVYYEKSQTDPTAIVARSWRVSRDYTKEYKDVITSFVPMAMYLFVPGSPGRAEMWEHYYSGWHERSSVISFCSKSMYGLNCCSAKSINEAVAGTPFQYSTWEKQDHPQIDCVKFFALYAKYPCVEYLTKMGYGDFVRAKLYDGKTYDAINWRGKTIHSVLRLNKQQLRELRSYEWSISKFVLRLYQLSRKDANPPKIDVLDRIFGDMQKHAEILKRIIKYVDVSKIISYVNKQLHRPEKEKYTSKDDVLIAWKDYLNECKKLNFNLSNERVLMPSNLFESHRKTAQQVCHMENASLDTEITSRLEKMTKKYAFETDKFLIRPAYSTWELINEGKIQEICIGGYAEDYAKGKTDLLFIRLKESPDIPFFAMEVKGNKIMQTQGFKHKSPTGEVQQLVDLFRRHKLEKKSKIEQLEEAV